MAKTSQYCIQSPRSVEVAHYNGGDVHLSITEGDVRLCLTLSKFAQDKIIRALTRRENYEAIVDA